MLTIILLAALPSAHALLSRASPIYRRDNNASYFNWTELQPSAKLTWSPCFDTYTCANLLVPLDYDDASIGNTTIAFIKRTAENATADTPSILLNPGGPGVSGVNELLSQGDAISQVVGPQYNLVGFDPRSVNNSGVNLNCFLDNPEAGAVEQLSLIRPFDSSSYKATVDLFEKAGAYGDYCSNADVMKDAGYANTIAVAHDMLTFIEQEAEIAGKSCDEAKLYYYGVSYGTVLGATFASLFPDRIGRMILDGVVDSEDYFKGAWSAELYDVDKAIEWFFSSCYAAGPSNCTWWANSTDEISQRTRNVLEAVRKDPIPVWDPSLTATPTIITYELVDYFLYEMMYSPLEFFPVLAQIFSELEQRNATTFAELLPEIPSTLADPAYLIGCVDGAGRTNLSTIDEWTSWIEGQQKITSWVADSFVALTLVCRNMHLNPPAHQQFNGTPSAANTSFPILFAGNNADPVTPIRGAHKMSAAFPGSVVLTQNAPGHIAALSAQSTCTWGYYAAYFADGTLPPANTTCETESVPFITVSQ